MNRTHSALSLSPKWFWRVFLALLWGTAVCPFLLPEASGLLLACVLFSGAITLVHTTEIHDRNHHTLAPE